MKKVDEGNLFQASGNATVKIRQLQKSSKRVWAVASKDSSNIRSEELTRSMMEEIGFAIAPFSMEDTTRMSSELHHKKLEGSCG